MWIQLLNKKFIFGININKFCKELYPVYLMAIILNISIHTYFYVNAILFSDKYISQRYIYPKNTGFIHIIMNEFIEYF